jgi:hypothetical protein
MARYLRERHPYSPARHQASFSAAIDLDLARQRAPSFDKLCRDIRHLVGAMHAHEA